MKNKNAICILFLFFMIIMAGCSREKDKELSSTLTPSREVEITEVVKPSTTAGVKPSDMTSPSVAPSSTPTPTSIVSRVICLDPGHQIKANTEKEPIGPGSEEMKYKVTGGAVGVKTKRPEYELVLTVSLLLQEELENRGYTVVMTRTINEVNLSNSERAAIANEVHADAFVRIHANAANSDASGAMTICQTQNNPYNGDLYTECRLLSQCILDGIIAATDAANAGILETDTMSGINWSTVPVTIVEMGFLSNATEDELLFSTDYQKKMVKGMADGIDLYFMEIESIK